MKHYWSTLDGDLFISALFTFQILKIGLQNGKTWKSMMDRLNVWVWVPVTGTCPNSTFSKNFRLAAGVIILKMSLTYPIIVSYDFRDPWYYWQVNVLRSFASPLCFYSQKFHSSDWLAREARRFWSIFTLFTNVNDFECCESKTCFLILQGSPSFVFRTNAGLTCCSIFRSVNYVCDRCIK